MEKIKVIGKGKNLHTAKEFYTFANEDANRFKSRSQASIDFGNVTRLSDSSNLGDDLVVQVQARLLGRLSMMLSRTLHDA